MKSSIGLFYQLTVRDKKGKVVRKTRMRRARSFCLAFLQVLMEQGFATGIVTIIKDVDGVNKTITSHATNFNTTVAAGYNTAGIVLGTGTTTPTNTDFQMETKIAHGSAATELNYAAQSFVEAQEVGANVDYQLVRAFQNLSGGTINVTEAGVISIIYSGGSEYALLIHDVFSAVAVADGETITATYTLRTTV